MFNKNFISARGKNRTCKISFVKSLDWQRANKIIQKLILQFAQESWSLNPKLQAKFFSVLYIRISTGDLIGQSVQDVSAGALLYSSSVPSNSNSSLVKQTFYSSRYSCLPELFAVMCQRGYN